MSNIRTLAGTLFLSAALAMVTVPAAARDHHNKCEEKVEKAEAKLEKTIRKHGEHSRQAEKQREEVERQRNKCGVEHDRH